jgi:hypothetical protein
VKRRFIAALVVLLGGALISTLFVMIATNGYGSAGIDENLVAVGYLVVGLGIVLLLSWLSAVISGGLAARLHWRSWITLPLMLLPALVIELILLLITGVVLAGLSRLLR